MRRSVCNDKCVPHFSMDRKSPVHHQHLMALPVTGFSILKQYPPAWHCPGGNAVWHRPEWAQEAPGRKFSSGSVSYFRDLYSARTIPGCLLPLHPLPCCVFPTLCVWTVKEIYLQTSGTKHHGLEVCLSVCVCVCGWGWKWIVFPLFGWGVYLDMGRKTVSRRHFRPGTRCINIHVSFLWCDTETMRLITRSENNTGALPKNV